MSESAPVGTGKRQSRNLGVNRHGNGTPLPKSSLESGGFCEVRIHDGVPSSASDLIEAGLNEGAGGLARLWGLFEHAEADCIG